MAFILRVIGVSFLMALMVALPRAAEAQPAFSKIFSPDTMGPGGTSTLTFTINNGGGGNLDSLAFTDVLPAGVTIANPASATTNCADGTLSAPNGSGTITYSGGRMPGGATARSRSM